MIEQRIKKLVREYYNYHGEKSKVVSHLQRESLVGGYMEDAYLCRVENGRHRIVYTVVIECIDANGVHYVTECFSDKDKQVAADSWAKEYEDE